MELSRSRETTSCAATQELPSFLWSPQNHYRCNKSLSIGLILIQTNLVHTTHSVSPRSILILYTHPCLGLYSGLFSSVSPTNNICVYFYPHSCYMLCPSHPPLLDHSDYTWLIIQITKILVIPFSPLSHHLIPVRSKYPPQHPVLKHPQSMFLPSCQRPSFIPI
jgi:hypothetical protein